MTNEERQARQQSLTNARRACEWLEQGANIWRPEDWERVKCLIAEFKRLDANAQRPRAGRKRIKTSNPKTLAQRRWREGKKD